MLGGDGLEIAAEAAVADERLVALGERGAQPAEDGVALLGIAPGLGEIATDDVASSADLDLLGLEFGEIARSPRHDQWDEGRLIVDNGAANFGTAALAHTKNVFELALLQRGDGLGTDHAAVGDDADAADAKPRPQPVNDRPAILPMSGRRSRSITGGMHFMGAVFRANLLSGAAAARLFMLRWRPAWSSGWRRGCSIRRSAPE